MKQRIIATILLIVMALSMLSSCDLFGDGISTDWEAAGVKVNDGLWDALQDLKVELTESEAEFAPGTDRDAIVAREVYNALANALYGDASNKLTEGTIGDHDVIDYYYYYTFERDGQTYTADFSKMTSTTKLILGSAKADTLDSAIKDALIATNAIVVADPQVDDATPAGTVVVAYNGWETVDENGKTVASSSKTAANDFITLDTANNKFHDEIVKNCVVGGAAKDLKVENADGTSTTYKGVKVLFNVGDINSISAYLVVDELEIEEDKTLTGLFEGDFVTESVTGKSVELEVKEGDILNCTYHVYPVSRVNVPSEATGEDIMRYVFGSSISASSSSVFTGKDIDEYKNSGRSFTELLADLTAEKNKDAAKDYADVDEVIDAQKDYDKKNDQYSKDNYEAQQQDYSDKLSTYNSKKSTYESEKSTYDTEYAADVVALQSDYEAKKAIVDNAGDAATEDQKKDLKDAEEAWKTANSDAYDQYVDMIEAKEEKDKAETEMNDAKPSYEKANASKAAMEEAKAALTAIQNKVKEDAVASIFEKLIGCKKADGTLITDAVKTEYSRSKYSSLQTTYDNLVATKVGQAVWSTLVKFVDVSSVDYDAEGAKGELKEIIDSYYDEIYDSYVNDFYKGTQDGESIYSKYITKALGDEKKALKLYLEDATGAVLKDGDKDMDAAVKRTIIEGIEELLKEKYIIDAVSDYIKTNRADDLAAYSAYISGEDYKKTFTDMYYYSLVSNANSDGEVTKDELEDINSKDNEKSLKKTYEYAVYNADPANFIVGKDQLKKYEKQIGSSNYDLQIDTYGKENIRTNLQLSNLMSFLLCTGYAENSNAAPIVTETGAEYREYGLAYVNDKINYMYVNYKITSAD